ncbi:MAG: UPF0104 family protein, partial [Chloroflexi bacterium]
MVLMKRRRFLTVALGTGISGLFLWLAFRELQPAQVWANIQQAQVGWLGIGAIVYFAAVTVIALRWQFLLRTIHHVPLKQLTPLVAIGYMGNNVYPFRAGEALRIFLLYRNHRIPIGRATTTVAVERTFDGVVMVSFILFSLLWIDIQSETVETIINIAAPIFFTAVIIFLALAARPQILKKLAYTIARPLPEKLGGIITSIADEIHEGLAGLRSPLHLSGMIISSYTTWAIEASVYWLVMVAFGFDAPYIVALLVVGTVNLAGLIPASPGQVGVYE